MLFRTISGYALGLVLLLTSCQAPEAYRKAAEAFSQGAELESRSLFPEENGEVPDEMVSFSDFYPISAPPDENKTAQEYYRDALQQIDKALGGSAQLKKNDMLDNALTIKALTTWRMDQYDQAITAAAEAEPLLSDNQKGEEDIRDLATVQALPGLINMDKAYAALEECMQQMESISTANEGSIADREQLYNKIKAYYTQSITNDADKAQSVKRGMALLDRAAENIEGNDQMELYLLNAQLAGLDTWGDLLLHVFTASRRLSVSEFRPVEGGWIRDERATYDSLVNEYLERLSNQLDRGERNPLYQYWKGILQGA